MSRASRASAQMDKDAETRIVEVTDDDIARGAPDNSGECPLALASCRVFPERSVLVSPSWVMVYDLVQSEEPVKIGGELTQVYWRVESEWRHNAHDFVNAFDNGLPVIPRAVTLVRTYQTED